MSLFDVHTKVERILLASGSPRRVELLRDAGFEVCVAPQDIDETPEEGESPEALVKRLAYRKALSARAEAAPGDVIIAADTTVALDGAELGKPADEADAKRMLTELSGKTHTVSTGVCIMVGANNPSTNFEARTFCDTATVEFNELTEADIESYVATGEPRDKAGAYGIQGKGRLCIKRIDGDYYTIVGLPIARVMQILDSMIDKEEWVCNSGALSQAQIKRDF